jgi:hypothetical protein
MSQSSTQLPHLGLEHPRDMKVDDGGPDMKVDDDQLE